MCSSVTHCTALASSKSSLIECCSGTKTAFTLKTSRRGQPVEWSTKGRMKSIRKAQESGGTARESLKKRCRARRNSASNPTASPSVVDSGSEVPRRRPRLPQPADNASGDKHEKSSTSSTASSNEDSSTSRPRGSAESCTLTKNGSPKRKESASQNGVQGPVDNTLQVFQNCGSALRLPEELNQTNFRSRGDNQDVLLPTDRIYHHAIIVEAATSESLQTSIPNVGYRTTRQHPQLTTPDNGKINTIRPIPGDRHIQPPSSPASNGILGTPKNSSSREVDTDNACRAALDVHSRVPPATLDERGETPQKPTGSANVLQILLGKQLPSCTASALSILESRLQGKLICGTNGTCGAGKTVVDDDIVARQETQSEDEEPENVHTLADQHAVTTDEATEPNRINCCSSNLSTLQMQTPPALYYTVLTSNGLHTKQEAVGNTVCLEEQVDHETYPVVKGVSRDNTKKRWAVYWKGSRKYFYDKCYADCHQAYVSAVEFRRQAKACNAPGPPPKRPALQSEFYLSAPTSSLRFTSCSPGITSFPTAPSTPPAFSGCETPSPCTAALGKCGPATMTVSVAAPEHQQLGSTRHYEISTAANERETAISRSDPDPCTSSPTTADSCENLTDTFQVYRCAAIILLQDLLYEVLPPRIATSGSARRASPSDPPLKARAEERFLSASLLLLQRTLQGHISKAERGGEEDLTQLLCILKPSLDRQLLPSELPRELQQTMLLQLTTLRL